MKWCDADIDDHNVGELSKKCGHCQALRFAAESASMCCRAGQVILPQLQQPPEPLWSLLSGADTSSRHFRQHIRQYNCAFNMASSTAKVEKQFPDGVQAFRINGVVYLSESIFSSGMNLALQQKAFVF